MKSPHVSEMYFCLHLFILLLELYKWIYLTLLFLPTSAGRGHAVGGIQKHWSEVRMPLIRLNHGQVIQLWGPQIFFVRETK